MSLRHGIVVRGGSAIDYSSLARPRIYISSRATKTSTNVGGIIFIILLALVAVSIIFCGIVTFFILKNKRKTRKRQRKMEESKPNVAHEYRQLEDMESGPPGIQELPPENQIADLTPYQRVELQSDVNEIPKIQQLDGFAAPARINTQPVELPPVTSPTQDHPRR